VGHAVVLPEGVPVPEDSERAALVGRQFLTSPFRLPSAP